jgi:protein-L-isoaspartate O-methyltransferase
LAPPQPDGPGSTTTGQAHLRQLIDRYADQLKANGAIHSPAVERAFRTVPRHRLLETFFHRPLDAADFTTVHHDPVRPRPEDLELIYSDTALGTRLVERFGARLPASSTSQPSLVANMLELLNLTHSLKVLEVGAGTGYNAALLAELVGEQGLVTSVDVAEDVVAQTRRLLAGAGYPGITVLCRDGFDGVAERAPFDRIVATVGCADVSPHWAAQLAEGRPAAGAAAARWWAPAVPAPEGGWRAGWPGGALVRVHGRVRPAPRRPAVVDGDRPTRQPGGGRRASALAGVRRLPDRSRLRRPGRRAGLPLLSQPGRPSGVLGGWWGRPERRAQRLGDRRPERHPLVAG